MESKFKNTNSQDIDILALVDKNGNALYKAIDLARALGYKRPDAAVKRFCKNPEVIVAPTFNQYGGRYDQPAKFIGDEDVMRMIDGCTLPSAVSLRARLREETLKAQIEAAAKAAAEKAKKEEEAKKAAAAKAAKAKKKAAEAAQGKGEAGESDIDAALNCLVYAIKSALKKECGTDKPDLIVIAL